MFADFLTSILSTSHYIFRLKQVLFITSNTASPCRSRCLEEQGKRLTVLLDFVFCCRVACCASDFVFHFGIEIASTLYIQKLSMLNAGIGLIIPGRELQIEPGMCFQVPQAC